MGIFFLRKLLRIENKTKPGIFDEKRGTAALLIKNSGFCFVRDPKLCPLGEDGYDQTIPFEALKRYGENHH